MKRIWVLGALLGAAVTAQAHELPSESLQVGSYTVITSFSLNQQAIEQTYAEASPYFSFEQWLAHRKAMYQLPADEASYYCGKTELPRVKTCGHIDPFYRAGMAAIVHCQAYALLHGYRTLIPKVTAPASYVSSSSGAAQNHHSLYDTSHGLSFQCIQPLQHVNADIRR